jgi:hypothetical protein
LNKLQVEYFHRRYMTRNRLSTVYIFVQSSGRNLFSNFSLNIRPITSASCCHHKYKTSLSLSLSLSLSPSLRASPTARAILATQKALFSILPTHFSKQTPANYLFHYFLKIFFSIFFFIVF